MVAVMIEDFPLFTEDCLQLIEVALDEDV